MRPYLCRRNECFQVPVYLILNGILPISRYVKTWSVEPYLSKQFYLKLLFEGQEKTRIHTKAMICCVLLQYINPHGKIDDKEDVLSCSVCFGYEINISLKNISFWSQALLNIDFIHGLSSSQDFLFRIFTTLAFIDLLKCQTSN